MPGIDGTKIPYLRQWRKSRYLSQEAMANLAGISRITITRLEHGDTAKDITIRRISKALGITPAQLMQPPSEPEKVASGKG